jgi:acetylserotonin N-methyltransferase
VSLVKDTHIYDIYVAARGSAALAVGVRLGLFSWLADAPRTEAELAKHLCLAPRGLASLCRALVGLELLERDGDQLRLSAHAAALVPGESGYLGDLIEMEFDAWLSPERLLKAVRRGRAGIYGVDDMWEAHSDDAERTARFARMMSSLSAGPAAALATQIDFSSHTHLLDVGGGSGIFTTTLLTAHPHLQATLYDLPAVEDLACSALAEAGIGARTRVVCGDMFGEPWPEGADVLLLSQILHDWTPSQCAELLRRAFEALEPGGTLLVHEKLVDSAGGPMANALVDLDMLFWTEGQQLTHDDAHGWLAAAGFVGVQIQPTVGYWSVASAVRPLA